MQKDNIFTKERIPFNLLKYQKFGLNFELVVDPDIAISIREKINERKQLPWEEIAEALKAEKIFSDAKKGEVASEENLAKVFQTEDFKTVVIKMVREGEIQLTSDYREKLREEKRKQIIQMIHRLCIDPRTNLPHPPKRIEYALAEAKIKIDEYAKAEDQIQKIIAKLKVVLPIKNEEKLLEIMIPSQYASKLVGLLKSYGKLESEQWLPSGEYFCRLRIPAGMQTEVIDELNSKTHGNVNINLEEKNNKKSADGY